MRKSILFGLAVLAVATATSAAQAGVFRRGGGCPGGNCGVSYSAQLEAPAEVAEVEPAAEPEVAAEEAEVEVVAEATVNGQRRFRLFRRR